MSFPASVQSLRYNASSGLFEGLVTLRRDQAILTYACEADGPITARPEDMAEALLAEALRQHAKGSGLRSVRAPLAPAWSAAA